MIEMSSPSHTTVKRRCRSTAHMGRRVNDARLGVKTITEDLRRRAQSPRTENGPCPEHTRTDVADVGVPGVAWPGHRGPVAKPYPASATGAGRESSHHPTPRPPR